MKEGVTILRGAVGQASLRWCKAKGLLRLCKDLKKVFI